MFSARYVAPVLEATDIEKARAIGSVIRALEALRDGRKPATGICEAMGILYGLGERVWNITKAQGFRSWSGFSGDIVYPVPHPEYNDPEDAFDNTLSTEFWLGEYGNNRRALLDHLIIYYKSLTTDELHAIAEGSNHG